MPVPTSEPHMLPTGGDAAVNKKRKVPLMGNVVKTYMIGNTTIHVCDDFAVKTTEETDAIISNFLRIGTRILRNIQEREQREKEMEAIQ